MWVHFDVGAGVQGAQNCAKLASQPDKYELRSFGAVNLGVIYSLKLLAAIPVTTPGFTACGASILTHPTHASAAALLLKSVSLGGV